MKSASITLNIACGLTLSRSDCGDAQLVICFGHRDMLADFDCHREIREAFPAAMIVGCSTGGQIADGGVSDSQVNGVALCFDRTGVNVAVADLAGASDSFALGARLGQQLRRADLAGVFLLSDGLLVNGSRLVDGLVSAVGPRVAITGGLAGDGSRFERTLVLAGGSAKPGRVVAVGLYGSHVRFGHGVGGGWDVFGPRRCVTRSSNNVLLELDGQPALDLYERYLGPEESAALPGSALLFPLQLRDPARPDHEVIRTVLAVDRQRRTMTFAGDIPEGWSAQLMRGRFERLAGAAGKAAMMASAGLGERDLGDCVALLVSCIGRRLLMGQHVVDELDAAREALSRATSVLGFYSYGEISPHGLSGRCELHNQSMCVTMIAEAA